MKFAANAVKKGGQAVWLLAGLGTTVFAQTPDTFNPTVNNAVIAVAPLPDGKVLLGGYFSYIGGQPHNGLGRVNSDGSIDSAFTPPTDAFVNTIAVQPDGSIVVGGAFATIGGQARLRLGRLSADGAVDPGFNPGADAVVECLALQPDGKILVGGFFGHLAGQPRSGLARLNPDGSLDSTFNPGANNGVTSLQVQPDGKIVVGGWFETLAGASRAHLGRLNADGTIDAAFNPGADNFVNCVAQQPDGKLVVGGLFTNLASQPRAYIGRLNADGSLDPGFNPGANDQVFSVALQTDGAIVVGGWFTNLAGAARAYLGRVDTNGVADASFDPGTSAQVGALAIQADGKVLVGGWFDTLGGSARSCLGRLNNTSVATQSLAFKTSKITWLRGGPSPEVQRVTFDGSTDGGTTWTNLGSPARIAGGWQLTSVPITGTASIRVCGVIDGGQGTASSWFVETNIGPLAIVQQPASRTSIAASLSFFTVRVGGGFTPSYQWRKDGVNLANNTGISGVTGPTLILSNVFGADAGAYTVVINDGHTSLTSQVATLTVLDPYITSQPVSLTNIPFTTATFTVAAMGQAPLSYAWYKNGAALTDGGNISGSQSPALTLSNVLGADVGSYWAVVSDASGSTTSVVARLTVPDPLLASPPTDQNVQVGANAAFTVGALGSLPMSFLWRHNGSVLSAPNASTLNLSAAAVTDAGSYDVIVSNAFGAVTSGVATLTVNSAAADSLSLSVTGVVYSLAVQGNNHVVFGGLFSGGYFDPNPYNIGRLNPDGTLDGSFYNSAGYTVMAVAIDTNGASILGGAFSSVDGQPRNHLARFSAEGSFDWSFNPGADGTVRCLAIQADGRILVGGEFINLGGQLHPHLGRLMPDGSVDSSFTTSVDYPVYALAVQPNGKILIGGIFQTVNGQAQPSLARLMSDGSLDTGFNPGQTGQVDALVLRPDGSIVVGGGFYSVGGYPRNNFARLNADGSVDPSFSPTADGLVTSLALQTDGKLIAGGSFGNVNGLPFNGVARLGADGSVDLTFNPGAGPVNCLALEKNGALVLGGAFSTLAGLPRQAIGRVSDNNPTPASESLTFGSSDISWSRSGAAPELWRATFELSSDGATWTPLGEGTRVAAGWQLAGLVIPPNSIVRARGFVVGGAWYVETIAGMPVLTAQPLSVTNNATSNVTFSVTAYGGTPLSYQWFKNGNPLSDGANLSGAQAPTLAVSSVVGADSGAYSVVLSNATGSVTSSVATLTVVDPWISTQPLGATLAAGQNVSIGASVVGTVPLALRWLRNGTALTDTGNVSGSQSSALVITNVNGFNAGDYQLLASNSWGSVTSVIASLTVSDPYIYANPISASVLGGQTVTLAVGANGTPPVYFQWRNGGSPLAGATNTTLYFNPVQGLDAGTYDVVVSDAFGSITSTVATLTVTDPYFKTNPTNQFLQSGQTISLSASAGGGSPLNYRWLQNGVPVQWATNASLVITNAQGTNAGLYRLVITDNSGSVTGAVAAVTVNASTADSFATSVANVDAIAIQADGKILLGMNDVTPVYPPSGNAHNPLRLNPDGSADPSFNSILTNASVTCLAIQEDSKILVAGQRYQRVASLFRLNPDGSVDTVFTNNLGAGPSGLVNCLALQPDGKIVLGGLFNSIGGQGHTNVARLNPDGSVDTNFNAWASGTVNTLALQPDGGILAGGLFTRLDGQLHYFLGRLNGDGSLDTNFNANASAYVFCLGLQKDGKILVGGAFNTLGGRPVNNLGRLNPDGSLDTLFNPNPNAQINSLAVQADGRILAGGTFTFVNGLQWRGLVRLNPDGSIDLAFNPFLQSYIDTWIYSLGVQPDGAVIAAGRFTNLGGVARTNLGRLAASAPAIQSLTSDASSITWMRDGTGPEVWRVAFDASPDGSTWTRLGEGQRIVGGWQATGLTQTRFRNLRARGFQSGGQNNSSSWFAQTVIGPPAFDAQPLSRTNLADTTATFYVQASGDQPLEYQWFKGGTALANGGNISGATTSVLILSNVFGADAGGYSVVVTNASGAITSAVAQLTVIEPVVTSQPTNQFVSTGQNATFSVSAIGTPPLNYQWRQNGTTLAGQTGSSLVLTNVTRAANAGFYRVIISSAFGSVISSNAVLMVDPARPDDFNPGAGGSVAALAVEPDSKILVGGNFVSLAGVATSYLGRLSTDGTFDSNFNPEPNGPVASFAVQPDEKIVVGGWFGGLAGQPRNFIGRLNSDGSLDPTFNPNANGAVLSLAIQPDGKILLGGMFTAVGTSAQAYIARLNPDGSVDTNFVASANNQVNTVALQPDGEILVAGAFGVLDSQTRPFIGRLGRDGTLDSTFNPGLDDTVSALALQPDGKIVAAGNFTKLGNGPRAYVGRLNGDGSPDNAFNPPISGTTEALALQADGKLIVGGNASPLAPLPGLGLTFMARLNPDGSVDPTFAPAPNSATYSFAIQSDGSVVVGGDFTSISGQTRSHIASLTPTDAAPQYLTSDGRSVTWLRGGTAPEVWFTTFDTSIDGTNWSNVGVASRIANGWQLTGLSLPAGAAIRARGYTVGGQYDGSTWFVQAVSQVMGPPPVLTSASFDSASGRFNLGGQAIPGQVIVIEATTDLVNWTPVSTNAISIPPTFGIVPPSTAPFEYSDETSLHQKSFYHARLYIGF